MIMYPHFLEAGAGGASNVSTFWNTLEIVKCGFRAHSQLCPGLAHVGCIGPAQDMLGQLREQCRSSTTAGTSREASPVLTKYGQPGGFGGQREAGREVGTVEGVRTGLGTRVGSGSGHLALTPIPWPHSSNPGCLELCQRFWADLSSPIVGISGAYPRQGYKYPLALQWAQLPPTLRQMQCRPVGLPALTQLRIGLSGFYSIAVFWVIDHTESVSAYLTILDHLLNSTIFCKGGWPGDSGRGNGASLQVLSIFSRMPSEDRRGWGNQVAGCGRWLLIVCVCVWGESPTRFSLPQAAAWDSAGPKAQNAQSGICQMLT